MDERLRFVAKVLDGEAMTEVCREFGSLPSCSTISSTSDLEQKTLQPLDNPVRRSGVTHVLGTTCNPCLRAVQLLTWRWAESGANPSPRTVPRAGNTTGNFALPATGKEAAKPPDARRVGHLTREPWNSISANREISGKFDNGGIWAA